VRSFDAKKQCLIVFCCAVAGEDVGEALRQFPTTFRMMPDVIGECRT
jgi:hypothetical protein